VKVMIVDDSSVFRTAIKAALRDFPEIEIVGAAPNGEVALTTLRSMQVDWVILDMEMPVMDGLETLMMIQEEKIDTRVIIFASPSEASYPRIRKCLELGAIEFITKPCASSTSVVADAILKIREDLIPLLTLGEGKSDLSKFALKASHGHAKPEASKAPVEKDSYTKLKKRRFSAIVVASSTGGPVALENFLSGLNGELSLPVFIVQHIPAPFTKTLADRLSIVTGVPVSEAIDGEKAISGRIYIAPADFHLELKVVGKDIVMELNQRDKINFVRPAADPLFSTAAEIYGDKLLSFVLTGMGSDGLAGAQAVRARGGLVMIQDRESSVVWGMPGAVHGADAYDAMSSLTDCAKVMAQVSKGLVLN
jgi:two-component system chemotaxis response regulator CheB